MENKKNYCMPDGIDSKEKHEQYLKDIGYKEELPECVCGTFSKPRTNINNQKTLLRVRH